MSKENGVLDTKDKTEQLVEYKQLEGTPFTIAKMKRKGKTEYIGLMGKYRMHDHDDVFYSEEEIEAYLKIPNWETVMQVMAVMIKEQDFIL